MRHIEKVRTTDSQETTIFRVHRARGDSALAVILAVLSVAPMIGGIAMFWNRSLLIVLLSFGSGAVALYWISQVVRSPKLAAYSVIVDRRVGSLEIRSGTRLIRTLPLGAIEHVCVLAGISGVWKVRTIGVKVEGAKTPFLIYSCSAFLSEAAVNSRANEIASALSEAIGKPIERTTSPGGIPSLRESGG